MTDKHLDNKPAKLHANDARGARPAKSVRYMLGASIAIAVVVMVAVLITQAG